VSALGLSQPGVSKHLRVLREASLVEVQIDAQRRVYRLRTEPLREIDEWLAPYRAAWAGRLGALEAHLDAIDNRYVTHLGPDAATIGPPPGNDPRGANA
jgi:DNA-binding transcriptional ArsR family regulator